MKQPRRLLFAAFLSAALLAPVAARADFVDEYKNNVSANRTEATNPVIRLLSGFDQLWIPGATWDTGTVTAIGVPVLDYNIQFVVHATQHRTDAEATAAYLDDRRNQSYSVIDGLGPLSQDYYTGSAATTTIAGVAADATTARYDDGGTGSGLASSPLGNVVALVNTLRGPFSSTTPPKNFFLYPRPYRQSSEVVVVPTLVPAESPTPATDSALPSGHTNAGYLASLAMAYAIPERFQELLTRASELGQDRVLAGMHSPLDVMGGRMQATALAAAILADPSNAALKQAAYAQAQAYLTGLTGATSLAALNRYAHSADTATDRFADHATNKADYNHRLTYDFSPINATDIAMVVPKGAEVLLETRFPYLDADQRREVLRTTGLASGDPLLDDPEGWGRLNLFAAADAYGAFNSDVTVAMDSSRDGFNAEDLWRNDISGVGKLTKQGTGTLMLTGNNTYAGGTEIDGGVLVAKSGTALGTGDALLNAGTLRVDPAGNLHAIAGTATDAQSPGMLSVADYTQRADGTLELRIYVDKQSERHELLEVNGVATFAGKLRIVLAANSRLADHHAFKLISFRRHKGTFAEIEIDGLPSGYKSKVIYTRNELRLRVLRPDHLQDRSEDGEERVLYRDGEQYRYSEQSAAR